MRDRDIHAQRIEIQFFIPVAGQAAHSFAALHAAWEQAVFALPTGVLKSGMNAAEPLSAKSACFLSAFFGYSSLFELSFLSLMSSSKKTSKKAFKSVSSFRLLK